MRKASRLQLKNIRRLLKEKKARDFEGLFVAEGEKMVKDMLFKKHLIDSVFVSASYAGEPGAKEHIDAFEEKGISVYTVGDAEFDKVSSLRHSQSILAVANKPCAAVDPFSLGGNAVIVLCDGIQDPGNLGTIIRTSAAMGADLVMLSGECADICNPKVVRASSGTILDVPLPECDTGMLDRLKKEGYYLLVSQVSKEKSVDLAKLKSLPERIVVAFGSEGQGVAKETLERANRLFHIPISEKTESLNVTSAVAIALYAIRYMLDAKK
ncbi:MAG: RNA methyltransferase [Candidatus Omnitrophota bacterium]